MDRDRAENIVDAEDRTTPSTGNSDFGEVGAKRARKAEDEEPDEPNRNQDAPAVIPPPD